MKSVSVLSTVAKLARPTFVAPKRNITNLTRKNIASVATTKTNVAQFLRFQTFGVRTFVEQQNRERRPRAPRPINESNTQFYAVVEGNRQNHDEIVNELQSVASNLGVADNFSTIKSVDNRTFVFFNFSNATDALNGAEQVRNLAKEQKIRTRLASADEVELVKEQITKPSSVVVLNKIPFGANETELREFLHEYKIVDISIGHGKAFIQFSSPEEASKVINEKQGITYGRSPIYVSPAIGVDLLNHRANPVKMVRVGSIAWGTEESAVESFFRDAGLNVNKVIGITENRNGNTVLNSVFIDFATPQDALKALSKDKENLGERPIRISLSSGKEIKITKDRIAKRQAEGQFSGESRNYERRERRDRNDGERRQRRPRREESDDE